jgi:DNA-binding MarR family transcriptional regulator
MNNSNITNESNKNQSISEKFTEIFELIYVINKKFRKFQRMNLESELTPSQYSILRTLWKSDKRTFKELSNICCCSQSTITGIIDTMERNHLVSRIDNPNDRRSLLVKLTDKGKKLKNETPSFHFFTKTCCKDLEPQEIVDLNHLLKKLLSSFSNDESNSCR